MELERPWPLALRTQPALGRMGSDELNAGKANPFMSKELFNYVWLITPNPSTPLTIYLFNQVSCTHHAAVCGWWWWRKRKTERRRERKRETKGATKQPFWRKHSRSSQKDSVFVLLAILQMHIARVPADQLLLTFKRSQNSCLERFQVESQPWWVSIPHWHTGFYQLHGKRKFKGTLPCVEKRLPGRLTQLPFIASDKRLNHTLHCLKCLLVIRSRILLSLLPLADCSWSKPNDGVSTIGSAAWVNHPIGMAICQGRKPC